MKAFLALLCFVALVLSQDATTSTSTDSNSDLKPTSLTTTEERAASADRNEAILQQKADSLTLSDADQSAIKDEAERQYSAFKTGLDALSLIPTTSPTEIASRLASTVREVQAKVAQAKSDWDAAVQKAKDSAAQRLSELNDEIQQRKDLLDRIENAVDGSERVKAAADTVAANFQSAQKDWEAAKDWIAAKAAEVGADIYSKYSTLVDLVKGDLTGVPPRNPKEDPAVIAAFTALHDSIVSATTLAQRVTESLSRAQEVATRAVAEAKRFAEALSAVQEQRETTKAKILESIHEKFSDSSIIGDIKRRAEVICGTSIRECIQNTNADSVGIDCHNVVPEDDNLDRLKKCFKAVLSTVGVHDEDTSVDAKDEPATAKRQSSGYTISATAAPDAQGTTSSSSSSGLSRGAIAGIVIGSVAACAILVIIVALVFRKDKHDYV